MNRLPPLPGHVLMPSPLQLDEAESVGWLVQRRWTKAACSTCHGTGKLLMWAATTPVDKEAAETAPVAEYECMCEDQIILKRWFAVRGVSAHMQGWRLADGVWLGHGDIAWMNERLKLAQMRRTEGAVLLGSSGTGKTFVAVMELKALMLSGDRQSMAIRATDAAPFAKGLDRGEMFDSWWGQRVKLAPHLVIDHLGGERIGSAQDGGAVSYALQAMIVERSESGLPTVVTTSLSEKDLQARYPLAYEALSSLGDVRRMTSETIDKSPRHVSRVENRRGITRPATFV